MKKQIRRRPGVSGGFTIIELIVVLVIIGILATAVVPRFMDKPDEARVTKAKTDIMAISTALKLYKLDNGSYPGTEQGLDALINEPTSGTAPMAWKPGGYLEGKEIPKDPWGTVYIYRSPGEDGADFEIISFGADKKEGGTGYNADINSATMR